MSEEASSASSPNLEESQDKHDLRYVHTTTASEHRRLEQFGIATADEVDVDTRRLSPG